MMQGLLKSYKTKNALYLKFIKNPNEKIIISSLHTGVNLKQFIYKLKETIVQLNFVYIIITLRKCGVYYVNSSEGVLIVIQLLIPKSK